MCLIEEIKSIKCACARESDDWNLGRDEWGKHRGVIWSS